AAVDLPFRKKFFYKSITDNAKRIATNEAKSGAISKKDINSRIDQLREKPTAGMIADAMVYAEEMVYADKNAFATGIRTGTEAASGLLRKKGLSKTAAATEMAAADATPFLKVPLNITWDVAKTSLLDSLKVYDQAPDVVRLALKGDLTPAQQKVFVRAVGNGGIGAGIMLAGWMAYSNGAAEGAYEPDQSNMRNTKRLANREPGSVKIGDTWHRIQDIASPVSNLFVLGATMAREYLEPDGDGNVGLAVANVMIDNPFFQSVKDIADIPERGFSNFVAGRAAAVVPAFIADTASMFDDTQRETPKQEGDSGLDVVGKKIA